MRSIDLNADLGEGFPNDHRLLELVSSASLSCGSHAGSIATARATARYAMERGVRVGAHPGYPDREGFGRRPQSLSQSEVEALILRQVHELTEGLREFSARIEFVKPHGALYNQAQDEEGVAWGVVQAMKELALPLLGLPGSRLECLASDAGVRFIAEGFPERRYGSDGRLVARSRSDAILHDRDEIEDQVIRLVDRGVETLCIHGDDPEAVAKAELVRLSLERRGIAVRPWRE
jgi:UPF0271 protein